MERIFVRRRFLGAAGLVVLLTAVAGAWIGLRIGGAQVTLWVDDSLTPLAALIACVLCFCARARQTGRMRTFWLLLGCATASWTFAEIVWGYYALILEVEVPLPSWADVGYLSAIPFAVAALVVHPATRGAGYRRARSVLDGLMVATALMFLSWVLVLGPLWQHADLSTWAGVVTLAYPFGDVVIVFFIVLAIRGMTGAHRLSLWCLLGALMVMALSDSTFTYLTEVAQYTGGSIIDTGWIAAYLGIALAAFSTLGAHPAVEVVAQRARSSLVSLIAPLLVVLLALILAAVELRLGHRLDQTAWLMAFALIALVLARQGLAALEMLHLDGGVQVGLAQRIADSALAGGEQRHPEAGRP